MVEGNSQEQGKVKSFVLKLIKDIQPDVDERKNIYQIRRDMFEGRHHKYSNVVGLLNKEQQGHVLPVFNYIKKFSKKLKQEVTNSGFRFKIIGEDESNDIEVARSEAVENFVTEVLDDNFFKEVQLRRGAMTQIRDGDVAIKCVVEKDPNGEKNIKMYLCEEMENLYVLWDDMQGTSFSALAYIQRRSREAIMREFPNAKVPDTSGRDLTQSSQTLGDHNNNQYATIGMMGSNKTMAPSGKNKAPGENVVDFWGWLATENDANNEPIYKIVNMVLIGTGESAQIVQYIKTDYKKIPWIFVHSEENPGKPWSSSFNDILFDANIELNDRSGEEADVIRQGANRKFVVKNMADFDADSLKTGSGQVIFIDGDNVDFAPLDGTINVFPSESYKNSMLDHLFSLGLPRIALSASGAAYSGRVVALQYQAVADEIIDVRNSWTVALKQIITMIQDYGIMFFPEAGQIFTISQDDGYGNMEDAGQEARRVEIDWQNPIPLSKSDAVVDASTLFDRKALPLRMLLDAAGYTDPVRIIKELKKEWKDPDLVPIRSKFENLAPAVVKSQSEASIEEANTQVEVQQITTQGQGPQNKPPSVSINYKDLPPEAQVEAAAEAGLQITPGNPTAAPQPAPGGSVFKNSPVAGGNSATPAPLKHSFQNQKRGVSSAKGAPVSGSVSQNGANRQKQQNNNVSRGQ